METNPEEFKIVVADDSPVYRRLVEDALAHEQSTVFVAKNGSEGLALVSAQRPAVVITDWEMPDLTGPELCQQIRRNTASYTYIILLTSKDEKDNIIKGLAAG